MLKKTDQLPIVAFTLSKRKCDSNADMLKTIDLVTATEKSHITMFFNKSISRLKGTDRSLPQVSFFPVTKNVVHQSAGFLFSLKPFQPSVAFYVETSHLICSANQVNGVCMKCNTGLK